MKILGQDLEVIKNQVIALLLNILAWVKVTLGLVSASTNSKQYTGDGEACIMIHSPGGFEQLVMTELKDKQSSDELVTIGYNVPDIPPPLANLSQTMQKFPTDLVLIKIHYFSINYADICIRWGLYESALRYVGWPIVAGFDFAGVVEHAGSSTSFQTGDQIFGFTMFGSYSTRLLVPASQIRKCPVPMQLPSGGPAAKAAAFPAVTATALHAVALANGWPNPLISRNKGALVHSAAGGVGSMLIQILKIQGFSPIVAVVRGAHKRSLCFQLGADHVIDKGACDLWQEASRISPSGYAAIFDANGIETLRDSYEHLSMCGSLVSYGFHSNLPRGSALLSPTTWLQMIYDMARMPKFDPMALVLESKTVAGFNLSFFANETDLIDKYMKQIVDWVEAGQLKVDEVTVFDMKDVGRAHELIQSGKSVGKIVCKTKHAEAEWKTYQE
jgi:NADPH:quinone reductase-like Zn-dependent oxidoreductase